MSLVNPATLEAEQYRLLCHKMERLRRSTTGPSVLAVSSAVVGDGKTTTAINFAAALAQSPDVRVLLIDTDLRMPSVGRYLGLEDSDRPGLVDLIRDPALTLAKAVQRFSSFNLSVLPAGRPQTVPYQLLKSLRLSKLLENGDQQYDYIILDTPPLIPVPDCQVIANWVHGVILVVAAHRTPRKMLEEALNVMDPAKIIGLIFNQDDRPFTGYYRYYYAYSRVRNND